MDTLHHRTRRVLGKAGWHPGRAVDLTGWESALVADGFPPLHDVARAFLAEFGGLFVPDKGWGVTRRREQFDLDPTTCLGEADRFADWSDTIGRPIAPVGELAGNDHGVCWLGLDAEGELFTVVDGLATFGALPAALDRLALGHMPRDPGSV